MAPREVTVAITTIEPGRSRSTPELLREVLDEAKLLARAEVEVAREELKTELSRAKGAGVGLGAAAALALCALSCVCVALGLALPMADWTGVLLVGVVMLVLALIVAAIGKRFVPKRPLQRTRDRLSEDVVLTRERLQ